MPCPIVPSMYKRKDMVPFCLLMKLVSTRKHLAVSSPFSEDVTFNWGIKKAASFSSWSSSYKHYLLFCCCNTRFFSVRENRRIFGDNGRNEVIFLTYNQFKLSEINLKSVLGRVMNSKASKVQKKCQSQRIWLKSEHSTCVTKPWKSERLRWCSSKLLRLISC